MQEPFRSKSSSQWTWFRVGLRLNMRVTDAHRHVSTALRGWGHVTLLRSAAMLPDYTAITNFHSSGLAELVDLVKVAPGLEQLRAFAMHMSPIHLADRPIPSPIPSRPTIPSRTSHGTPRPVRMRPVHTAYGL